MFEDPEVRAAWGGKPQDRCVGVCFIKFGKPNGRYPGEIFPGPLANWGAGARESKPSVYDVRDLSTKDILDVPDQWAVFGCHKREGVSSPFGAAVRPIRCV